MNSVQITSKIKIAYITIGDLECDAPLLLFLHEGMGSISMFRDFPKRLCEATGFPGLVFDRYGYGHSTALQEDRTIDYLETEAKINLPLLVEHLNLNNRKLIIVGHSDGASIALIYAGLFPKNVIAVVSIAAHVFTEELSIRNVKALEERFYSNDEFRAKLERYHFEHTESTLIAFTRTITSESFKNWNIENYLSSIEAPVLVIQGTNDEYGTLAQVESIMNHASHPQNKKIILDNYGHSPHLENKEGVVKHISEFIKAIIS
ncbi:MAG: alpha/beta hydrolase [Sphingobacteriaceae bacterium]|nr:alpha/beta hydrolase [Sphingobacteriaceae bacterium]